MEANEANEANELVLHPAVQLLIARMESHPEEFVGGNRWKSLISTYEKFFSPEEARVFQEHIRKAHLDWLHTEIMRRLTSGAGTHVLGYADAQSVHSASSSLQALISQAQMDQAQAMQSSFRTGYSSSMLNSIKDWGNPAE